MAVPDSPIWNSSRTRQKKPGKIAPYFLETLFLYNLLKPLAGGYNLLTDFPKHSGEGIGNTEPAPCTHAFRIKPNQSVPPSIDTSPNSSTHYVVAAICARCRVHLEVEVDFRNRKEHEPCPSENYPFHHLVHVDSLQPRREAAAPRNREDWREIHVFECSSSVCPARVTVRLKLPMLNDEAVQLLTDHETLKLRQDNAFEQEGDRLQGIPRVRPIDVLNDLRIYIKNSWTKRSNITLNNRRFMTRFGLSGLPCKSLLEFVGFTFKPDQYWVPPQPPQNATTPYEDPLSKKLDDIEMELATLILLRPHEEQKSIALDFSLQSALADLTLALGYENYERISVRRTTTHDESWHRILGVPIDAADEILVFAYRRQAELDERQIPWYLSCLHYVASQRNSETLATLIATEKSAGRYDTFELGDAYRYLGFEISNGLPEENHVIGTFNSRLEDTAPQQQAELRRSLQIIGDHLNSPKILAIATDTLETPEQAYSYLDVERTVGDDLIITMFSIKVSDHPDQESKARKAVNIIAHARSSRVLQDYLETGVIGEVAIDIGEAYQLLGIDDRTTEDSIVRTVFDMRAQENQGSLQTYQKALRTIAEDRNSTYLLQEVGLRQHGAPASVEWPVGLRNIGNTCYLNSLLQFFFTVSSLRNVVLDFENVRMDLSEDAVSKKQVSARRVDLKEIKRSQNFVLELRKLFENMIKSPEASVTPDLQLARLALVSSKNEDVIRRKSTLSGNRPSLGELNGVPVQGPVGPPAPELSQHTIPESPTEVEEAPTPNNPPQPERLPDGGDRTLAKGPDKGEDTIMADIDVREEQRTFNDKENLPPQKADAEHEREDVSLRDVTEPSGNSSPTRTSNQAGDRASLISQMRYEGKESKDSVSGPPNRPPPVPPRPKLQATPDPESLKREVELGAQHDVSEVIENFLFQLSCAIKPTSIDSDGEQSDQIKRLFWGRQKSTIISPDGESRHMESIFPDIKVVPSSGYQDVYSVLDGAFDIETVDLDSKAQQKYTSITQAPPILQINIQRAQWDRGRGDRVKNNNHVVLPEVLYLDRYLDEGPDQVELLDRRKETWRWKQELQQKEDRHLELSKTQSGTDAPSTLRLARDLMKRVREDGQADDHGWTEDYESAMKTLDNLADQAQTELSGLDHQIRDTSTSINSQFADLRQHPYRIHALYFHRGRTSSGHYWIYIHDFEKGVWRKYNDTFVSEVVDTAEIFSDPHPKLKRGEDPANPYIVVYVQDPGLVKSVCREIREPTDASVEDIVMLDQSNGNDGEAPSIQHLSITGKSSTDRPSRNWEHSEANIPSVKW